MMPQEVRKLAKDKSVLLVEGQSPILAEKLKFFETAPFKKAEAYSKSHRPSVPLVDILPSPPVPALTEGYEAGGEGAQDVQPAPLKVDFKNTVEVITDDGEIIDVPPETAPYPKSSFTDETGLEIKVLAAKTEVAKPLDLFGREISTAASKSKSMRKKFCLHELRNTVVLDPV